MTYKELQDKILKIMSQMDRTGTNTAIYKEFFENTTEQEFIKMTQHPNFKLRFEVTEFEVEAKYNDLIDICHKNNFVYQERVIIRRGPMEVLSKAEVPIFPLTVNRLQQRVEGESASATDLDTTNRMGQVEGDSKGAQVSDLELAGCVGTDRKKTIEEFYKIRSGNEKTKSDAYRQIVKSGDLNIADVKYDLSDRTEFNMIRNYYIGMNIDMREN